MALGPVCEPTTWLTPVAQLRHRGYVDTILPYRRTGTQHLVIISVYNARWPQPTVL